MAREALTRRGATAKSVTNMPGEFHKPGVRPAKQNPLDPKLVYKTKGILAQMSLRRFRELSRKAGLEVG